MAFKYSYMVVTTTDFELEPILEQYFAIYPQGEFERYEIVFRADNEHQEGNRSYIVVFTLGSKRVKTTSFSKFLEAYCELHDKVAIASQMSHVLPGANLAKHPNSGMRIFGTLKA